MEWSNGAIAVLVAEATQFGELDVYYNRYGDGEWETQKVTVVSVPWRFGSSGAYGSRRYFECGICHRRVWRLHTAGGCFACRRCSRLDYSTQYEAEWIRAERRVRKIERRLGGSAFQRPRRMWLSTYARLLEKAMEADEIADKTFGHRLEKFIEWADREKAGRRRS